MPNRLLKSTLLVAIMTNISRVFGLLRDIVIAHAFGAGSNSDAFFVAFKIPNYLRRLFAEGGFSQAFVPVLTEYKAQADPKAEQGLLDHVCGTLAGTLFGLTVFGVVAAPLLIVIFAPGFLGDHAKFDLSVELLRITFPYILFISLTALAGGILNVHGRFAVPALTPVLLNLSLIVCAIWLAPLLDEPITALAWGVFLAGIAQLVFQLPFLFRIKRLPRPKFAKQHPGVGKIIRLMIPTLFAVSITQINLIVDMIMASLLPDGSISWLYYSDRLMEFPLGVFGVALATVILPNLSTHHVEGRGARFSEVLDWALRWVLLISVPAALGLIVLAEPIIATLFQHGTFNAFHVNMSGQSLIAYAAGLPAFIAVKILVSGYYARQDTKTPVKIAVVAMFSNIVMNLLLIGPLAHAGLALATSLAAFINAGLLLYGLVQRRVYRIGGGWLPTLVRVALATAGMTAVLYGYAPTTTWWVTAETMTRIAHLGLWVTVGGIVYFMALLLSGVRLRQYWL